MAMRRKIYHSQVSASFGNWLPLGEVVGSIPLSGRGQCVCLLPVFSLLAFLQAGFEFRGRAYSSSLIVYEFSFSLID